MGWDMGEARMPARLACATAPVAHLGEAQFGLIVDLVERTARRLRPSCAAMSDERFDALVREVVDFELRRLGDRADGGGRAGR